MIHVEVFWVVTSFSDAIAYQRFGEHCCLHLQGEVRDPNPCPSHFTSDGQLVT